MAITVEGLRKVYPGGKVALDGVDLVCEGTFGLLGPNGAGKTTLLRIVATLVGPTAGGVTVEGLPHTERARIRRLIGYLPQRFGFYPQLTAEETVCFMAALSDVAFDRRRARELLGRVGLADRARTRVAHLSGGMVQRLGIACALIGEPRALIVDEPTAGLDHESRMSFRNLLAGLSAQDRTVLLSTHIVADVETCCGRLAVLRAGRVAFRGTPAELSAQAAGRVWEVQVPLCEWAAFEAGSRPVAAVRVAETVRARVVADSPPHGRAARPLVPAVEDGYVWVLRTEEALQP